MLGVGSVQHALEAEAVPQVRVRPHASQAARVQTQRVDEGETAFWLDAKAPASQICLKCSASSTHDGCMLCKSAPTRVTRMLDSTLPLAKLPCWNFLDNGESELEFSRQRRE